jgi:RNase H-like domain found in reverse transcriptase
MKIIMSRALVLGLPDFTQLFTIQTDACQHGMGVVLMQNKSILHILVKNCGLRTKDYPPMKMNC